MCSVTKCSVEKVLISSHILPWSKSNDSQRKDVGNGLLLSPNLDSLFDRHLIQLNQSHMGGHWGEQIRLHQHY